jgi:hypothetical protein
MLWPRDPWVIRARRRAAGETLERIVDAIRQCGFSESAYLAANPDLVRALPDHLSAMMHFIATGSYESRVFPVDLRLDGLWALSRLDLKDDFKASMIYVLINNYCQLESSLWKKSPRELCAFWAQLVGIIRSAGTPYVIIGDSHSILYRQLILGDGAPIMPVHIMLSASSAMGLSNPASRSGARQRLAPLAEALPDSVGILFKFGQVDVEFVSVFKRVEAASTNYDLTEFDQFCRRSVRSYIEFLSTHFCNRDVAIISTFPPALSDEAWRAGYINAHVAALETDGSIETIIAGVKQLQIPTLPERTRQHARYNEMLRGAALEAGFDFIDDFSPFLGPGAVLDPAFVLTSRGSDHHLERAPTTPTIKRIIVDHLRSRKS